MLGGTLEEASIIIYDGPSLLKSVQDRRLSGFFWFVLYVKYRENTPVQVSWFPFLLFKFFVFLYVFWDTL